MKGNHPSLRDLIEAEKHGLGVRPTFGKATPEAAKRGIGKTALYELIRAGLLRTFKIGNATYVEFSEFDALPDRLRDPEAQARLAAVKRGNSLPAC